MHPLVNQPCSCPVCGGELKVPLDIAWHAETGTLVSSNYSVRFTRREGEVFDLLWRHRSRTPLSQDRLFHHLYSDDPNGGPLGKVIQVLINRMRTKLVQAGANVNIVVDHGRGYCLQVNTPARLPRKTKAAA